MATEILSEGHRLSSGIMLISPEIEYVFSVRGRINENMANSIKEVAGNILKILKNGTDNDGWKRVNQKHGFSATSGHGHGHGSGPNQVYSQGNKQNSYGEVHNGGSRYSKNFRTNNDNDSYSTYSVNNSNDNYYRNKNNVGYKTNSYKTNNSNLNYIHTPIPSYSKLYADDNKSITNTHHSHQTSPQVTPTHNKVNQEHRPVKYVSRFKTIEQSQNMDAAILNTIILGKLNKFSQTNYNDIKEFLEQILDSGQTDFLKSFMQLVFEKAATEKNFCALYARLLGELSANYSILLTEMSILYNKYFEIFDEISEDSVANYSEFVKLNDEKKYRLGYSQFLSQLLPLGVIKEDIFINVINKIIHNIKKCVTLENKQNIIEEYASCLACMLATIPINNSDNITLESVKTAMRLDKTLTHIIPFTEKNALHKSLTAKSRFALLDILETFGNDYI